MSIALITRCTCLLLLAMLPVIAHAQSLTVSAATSLGAAFKDIGARFDAARGTSTRFNFAASGVLLTQIAQGAPVDVFVSADTETLERGIKDKLFDPSTRRDFAANSLVLIAPMGVPSAVAIGKLGDVVSPGVKRVAAGKLASTPVGHYTRQALESAGLWSRVEARLVFADNVRQALDYVARGEVDAGFVYRTDAELMKGRVQIVATVGGHSPITYPAAVVQDSRQPALARAFVDFLFSAEAQAILARYGFGKP